MKKRMKNENNFAILKGVAILLIAITFLFLFNFFKTKNEAINFNKFNKTLLEVNDDRPIYVEDYEIIDVNLYKALLDFYNEDKVESEKVKTITTYMFDSYESIDLSNKKINNLSGLELLHFSNLKSMNLSNNEIQTINEDCFTYAPNLKDINLYNNEIKTVSFKSLQSEENAKIEDININLSHNLISKIELNNIKSGNIDLSYNLINSTYDIYCDDLDGDTLQIDLYGNNITNLDKTFNNVKLNIGLQGTGFYNATIQKFERTKDLKIFKIADDNVKFVIFNVLDLENPVLEVLNSEITESYTQFNLQVGNYVLKYYDATTNENLFDATDEITYKFQERKLNIIPVSPTIRYYINGKEYNSCVKFSGTAKVKFFSEDENAEIYYCIDGGQWTKGTEAEIKSGGNYLIHFKSVVNGIESFTVVSGVVSDISPYMSDGVLLFLIVATIVLFIGVAIPLIRKYIMK